MIGGEFPDGAKVHTENGNNGRGGIFDEGGWGHSRERFSSEFSYRCLLTGSIFDCASGACERGGTFQNKVFEAFLGAGKILYLFMCASDIRER